jgi:hypothetical protein
MGFFSRLFLPRSVRRAARPVRTAKRAVTPKPVTKLQRAMNPVSNVKYSAERSLGTSLRSGSKPKAKVHKVYRHGNCPINHRSQQAAERCRNA